MKLGTIYIFRGLKRPQKAVVRVIKGVPRVLDTHEVQGKKTKVSIHTRSRPIDATTVLRKLGN